MKNKFLTLLAASSFAFFMQACGDDSSSSSGPNDDEDISSCSSADDEDDSSSSEADDEDASSSSKKDADESKDDESSSSAKDESSPSEEVKSSIYVFNSDYSVGELRWIDDGKLSKEKIEFYQDSKVVAAGGNLFVLERVGHDNVIMIDEEKKDVAWQASLEDYSNPTDIVAASETEAWVALEGVSNFVKISLKDGKVTKTVKTEDFVSEGGYSPNLSDLEVSGDTLMAIFQRYVTVYDDTGAWAGTNYPNGLLALYTLKDGKLLDTIQLAGKNPSAVAVVKGNVYVASTGDYATADDCGIEKVDLSKKKSSFVVTGEKLGAGVYSIAFDYEKEIAYAAIYKSWGDVPVAVVDLAAGSSKIIEGISDAEGGLAFDAVDEILYVGDRSFGAETLYAYDGKKATKIETADEKTLPPYNVAVK